MTAQELNRSLRPFLSSAFLLLLIFSGSGGRVSAALNGSPSAVSEGWPRTPVGDPVVLWLALEKVERRFPAHTYMHVGWCLDCFFQDCCPQEVLFVAYFWDYRRRGAFRDRSTGVVVLAAYDTAPQGVTYILGRRFCGFTRR